MTITAHDTIVEEINIQASAECVFDALVEPEQRIQWWGVAGKFQATSMESDLRPGGAWAMRGTAHGDKVFTIRGEYRVVERPRLLEFTWTKDDEPVTIVRFELTDVDGATTVRLTHSGLTERLRNSYQGWPWLLQLLRGHVESR
jgi:uncharacterized protein YndB with AHSA1/START domain